MAEIQESGGGKHKGGKVRSKKQSTKVDMTPMVDLGFLLITFFMFTTTFSKPNIMKLTMPDKQKKDQPQEKQDLKPENTISIIPGKDDKVYYHSLDVRDLKPETLNETDYSKDGLRKAILTARARAPKPENFTVIIKPADEANYKNVVDVLDEMEITKSERYAIVKISKDELAVYKQKVGIK